MMATKALDATPLLHYEFVVSEDDFAVLLNGDCHPSKCVGYSVDTNWSFVLHQEANEIVTSPIPLALRSLVENAEEVWFSKIADGAIVDTKVLARIWPVVTDRRSE